MIKTLALGTQALEIGIVINGRFFFTAANNGGLGASANVAIRTNAQTVGPWEQFNIVKPADPNQYAFQTYSGNYVTACNNGGMGGPNSDASPIHTDATDMGAWQTFTLEPQPNGSWAIRTSTGFYWTAINGGGWGGDLPVNTDRTVIGPWERFDFAALI